MHIVALVLLVLFMILVAVTCLDQHQAVGSAAAASGEAFDRATAPTGGGGR